MIRLEFKNSVEKIYDYITSNEKDVFGTLNDKLDNFRCMICKKSYLRTYEAKKRLIRNVSYENHEICCRCSLIIINNNVFECLRNLLLSVFDAKDSVSNYDIVFFDIQYFYECLKEYLAIKNFFKI